MTTEKRSGLLGRGGMKGFVVRSAIRAVCVAGARLSFADTTIWVGGSGLWDDPTHWTTGVPVAGDNAVLSTNGATTVYLSGPAGTLHSVTVSAPGVEAPHTLLIGSGGLSANLEIVGDAGVGAVNQTAGTNTVPVTISIEDGRLVLGNTIGGSGTYNLSGGTLQADIVTVGGGTTALNTFGTGTFVQSGGTVDLTVLGTVGELLVGDAGGSTGSYLLSGGNLFANSIFVAVSGTSLGERKFVQNGGTATIGGDLQIGGFSGGANNTTGSYTLSGTASSVLSAANEYVGVSGIGTFTQEGGTNSINRGVAGADRNLLVGAVQPNSEGTYQLRNGTVSAEGEFVGNPGRGTFVQSGGTNLVNGQLLIDTNGTASSSGTYTISGGNLTTTGSGIDPGLLNLSQMNLNGGVVTVNGTGASAGLDNRGTISMAGGILAGAAPKLNAGTLTGYGSIIGSGDFYNRGSVTFTGGTTTVQSNTINEAGRALTVSNSVAVFDGTVTNNGTIKTTAANVIFNGDYAGGGNIISDPSTQTFNKNFSVSDPGTLVGSTGDNFRLGLNVNITSANNTGWSTERAQMEFFKGTTNATGAHDVTYPGMDLGPTSLGYVNNFAWGIVSVGSGNELTNTSNNALYTRQFALGDGVAQISSFTGNLSIWYDPTDPANSYLGGQTYPFGTGDGFVAPIPEPSAVCLLVMSSAALRMRRQHRQ